ncbi:MAG: hypothetical protein CAF45_006440 [Nitrospira sp. CG24E]|nr:MAG: hypothetical protein CAF45_006440 [Nitrospira sp. CG24E]
MSDNGQDSNMMTNRIRREQGFGLLEAMVSSTILAIGLLGLAAMTTLSFTRNSDGNEMTVATNLATELVERMQFNRRNLVNGYNGINLTSANPALCAQNALTQPVARGDCLQWQTRLFASGLVGVTARVAVVQVTAVAPPPPVWPAPWPAGAWPPAPWPPVGPPTLNQNAIAVNVVWIGSSRNTIAGGSADWVAGTKAVTLNTMIAPDNP